MTQVNIGGATITYNGAIPSSGAQSVKTDIALEVGIKTLVDMSHQYSLGKMQGVQTLYIDMSEVTHDVVIHMPDTGQRIKAYARTQGYYPVLSTTLMKFEVTGNNKEVSNVPIHFINFPIALGVWRAVPKSDTGGNGNGNGNGNGGTASLAFANIVGATNASGESITNADGVIPIKGNPEWSVNDGGLFEFDPVDPSLPEWEQYGQVRYAKRGGLLVSATIIVDAEAPLPESMIVTIGGIAKFYDEIEDQWHKQLTGFTNKVDIFNGEPRWEGDTPQQMFTITGIYFPPRPREGEPLPELVIAFRDKSVNIVELDVDMNFSLLEEW